MAALTDIKQEPAVIVSTLTSALTAIVGLGLAFGLDISDAQRNAMISVIAPVVGAIFLIGPLIRQLVYSPNSTQKIANSAAATGDTTIPTPPANK